MDFLLFAYWIWPSRDPLHPGASALLGRSLFGLSTLSASKLPSSLPDASDPRLFAGNTSLQDLYQTTFGPGVGVWLSSPLSRSGFFSPSTFLLQIALTLLCLRFAFGSLSFRSFYLERLKTPLEPS